ncbi:MAG: ribonucleotide-diphosphate reductase subunit beta [Bdellovibrionaceae bacterium]|nr:ribonucleotide-diphosphate reductase subunit beta [Pseudobdellovibrionaceae bacterium]
MILDPGFNLTLRPMKYPVFYEMYKNAIKNTWTVDEVDFSTDLVDLHHKMKPSEKHLINRLVAFFATGDSIVANNLVLNLYKHVNSPEARMYLSRQLFEEALHVQFYLTLLDTYIPNPNERERAFAAIDNIPSIKKKADFSFKWIDSIFELDRLDTLEKKRQFLLNQICFAACIEGLFFFAAFAYIYFLRSKGLLAGLATGTNWVFRDESLHMAAAFECIQIARQEDPRLFTPELGAQIKEMIEEAIMCEMTFAQDLLEYGVAGLTLPDIKQYLQYVADQRFETLELPYRFGSKNPFPFMELQDMQELANFFERRVSAYQTGVSGQVTFDEHF